MRKAPIALLCTAACAILAIPAISLATPQVGQKSNGFSITDERYLQTYEDCWKAFKARCGRNIVDDQLSSGQAPTEGRVEASTSRMDSWLHPPAPEPAVTDVGSTSTPQAPVQTSYAPAPTTSGDCPAYTAAEASSSTQYNTQGSGAYGCFQIMPDTAAGAGCSLDSVESQIACAAALCAESGSAPWESSGMDPCPYVQP